MIYVFHNNHFTSYSIRSPDIFQSQLSSHACMLQDNEEKQFLFRHSRTCFELLDDDGSEAISLREFERFGFLFNFGQSSIKSIFKEFDVSGDKELDYNEFRMFTFACIDRERELEEEKQRKKEQEMEIQERTEQVTLKPFKFHPFDFDLIHHQRADSYS
eukprot:TRINITY_DN1338_c0_g1_i6.p1 TRINITY_DN1338_c0_g1~~TRINITY_DN1338_c0_g1_i6.p1  ORF type:complete len:159 (-),score=33.54 TRINITY_DN1338_c0_g1_i6:574-1050(-)